MAFVQHAGANRRHLALGPWLPTNNPEWEEITAYPATAHRLGSSVRRREHPWLLCHGRGEQTAFSQLSDTDGTPPTDFPSWSASYFNQSHRDCKQNRKARMQSYGR